MKTRQQSAREYADKACDTTPRKNDGYPLTRTLGELKDDAIQDFLAGCEHADKERWIPVGERLPHVGYWVLARSWRGTVMASYWKNEWRVYNHNAPGNFMSIDDVTHWMPLPSPPSFTEREQPKDTE